MRRRAKRRPSGVAPPNQPAGRIAHPRARALGGAPRAPRLPRPRAPSVERGKHAVPMRV